jgi:hypothetical protein
MHNRDFERLNQEDRTYWVVGRLTGGYEEGLYFTDYDAYNILGSHDIVVSYRDKKFSVHLDWTSNYDGHHERHTRKYELGDFVEYFKGASGGWKLC